MRTGKVRKKGIHQIAYSCRGVYTLVSICWVMVGGRQIVSATEVDTIRNGFGHTVGPISCYYMSKSNKLLRYGAVYQMHGNCTVILTKESRSVIWIFLDIKLETISSRFYAYTTKRCHLSVWSKAVVHFYNFGIVKKKLFQYLKMGTLFS